MCCLLEARSLRSSHRHLAVPLKRMGEGLSSPLSAPRAVGHPWLPRRHSDLCHYCPMTTSPPVSVSLLLRTPVVLEQGPPTPYDVILTNYIGDALFPNRSRSGVLGLRTSTCFLWGGGGRTQFGPQQQWTKKEGPEPHEGRLHVTSDAGTCRSGAEILSSCRPRGSAQGPGRGGGHRATHLTVCWPPRHCGGLVGPLE